GAGPVAATADDPRAEPRPAGGLDPRAQRGAAPRGAARDRQPRRSHGVESCSQVALQPGCIRANRSKGESAMATDRRAEVTWNGSVMEGSGTITSTTSGAIGEQAVSWPARSEDATGGKTSPEELIAAAHAACFSMALSHGLAQAGNPADELTTSATVTFQ